MTKYLWTEVESLGPGEGVSRQMLVLPEGIASYWLRHLEVLNCSTWAEVQALGPDLYVAVLGLAGDEDLLDFGPKFSNTGEMTSDPESLLAEAEQILAGRPDLPNASEPLQVEQLWGYGDGDWPPSVHVLMRQYLPAAIQERFSIRVNTYLQGDLVFVPAQYVNEVRGELTSGGDVVVEDNSLQSFATLPD